MIQGFRESDLEINIRVDRSERDALERADAASDLARTALEKGLKACGKGDDCCLSVIDSDSASKSASIPTRTFEIKCAGEDCNAQGVEAAESEIVFAIREMAGS